MAQRVLRTIGSWHLISDYDQFWVARDGRSGSDFGLQPESRGHADRFFRWCFDTAGQRDRMAIVFLTRTVA